MKMATPKKICWNFFLSLSNANPSLQTMQPETGFKSDLDSFGFRSDQLDQFLVIPQSGDYTPDSLLDA